MAEKKELWLNFLVLYTVALAVCATLSTFKEKRYSDHSVISQTQASDQWAYYQAKTIKSSLYQAQRDNIQLLLDTMPSHALSANHSIYLAKFAEYDKKVKTYELEKKFIQQSAQLLEIRRDEAQRRSQPFGMAVIFLQVAILSSIIAGVLKHKVIWYMSLPVGLVGLLCFANGFLLLF